MSLVFSGVSNAINSFQPTISVPVWDKELLVSTRASLRSVDWVWEMVQPGGHLPLLWPTRV